MSLFPRPTTGSARLLALLAAGLLSGSASWGQEAGASNRESVEVEPYTGPAIYLPEGEAPPPPTQVESRVIKEKFPGTEVVRFERRVVRFSDESVVSDGPTKEYYSSGQLYVEGELNQGVAIGTWTYHHRNGTVAKTVQYADGKPNGEVKVFNKEGKLVASRQYDNGLRAGTWAVYSDDGETQLREDNYADGKANGIFKVWFPNGQLQREIPFVDGKQEGVATEWSRTGEKRAEVPFKDGKRHGVAKVWRRDGEVVEQAYEEGKLAPGA